MRVVWHDKEVMKKIDEGCSQAAKKSAEAIIRTAKSTTLFQDDSGDLRASMRVDQYPGSGKKGGYLAVAGGQGAWGDAYYAPMVHLGHRTRGGGHVGPRPFLWRALDANRRAIIGFFKNR